MAQRSASGSSAMAMSAPTRSASASNRSDAPFSSGFGKGTVGKSPSGAACSATTWTSVNPARCNALTAVSPPTPCIGVIATRIPAFAAEDRASEPARSR